MLQKHHMRACPPLANFYKDLRAVTVDWFMCVQAEHAAVVAHAPTGPGSVAGTELSLQRAQV